MRARRPGSIIRRLRLRRHQVSRLLQPVRAVTRRPGRGPEAPQGGGAGAAPARGPHDPRERGAARAAALRRAGGAQGRAAAAQALRWVRRGRPDSGRQEEALRQRSVQEEAVRRFRGQGALFDIVVFVFEKFGTAYLFAYDVFGTLQIIFTNNLIYQ